jgi:hypothetical protein
MNPTPLLALATAAALPQLAFDADAVPGWTGIFILDEGNRSGICVLRSPNGFISDHVDETQRARAAFVAAACNAVRGLVQERGLLLEALGKIAILAEEWSAAERDNAPYWNLGDIARAAIKKAEAGN